MNRVFYPFYKLSICRILCKLDELIHMSDFIEVKVLDGIKQSIYTEFHKASVRVLILELHLCKDHGMLGGTSPAEEYESFERLLQDKNFRGRILQKYPGLNDCLEELEKNQYQFWKEVLERLVQDWTLIRKHFFSDELEQKVTGIRTVDADVHCGGKSVVRFETNRGLRFFYKPHTLANELVLQELTEQMYRSMGESAFSYRILDCGEYGWEEEVKYCECSSVDEAEAAYRKFGILASLTYLLGTQDLHYENVIMHGPNPVIVDAESLVSGQERLYRWNEGQGGFYTVLSGSLFPGGNAPCKFAGMTGGNGELLEYKVPAVVDERTSDMRIEYKNPIVKEGNNRIILRGRKTSIKDYADSVFDGFERGYHWILSHFMVIWDTLRKYQDRIRNRYIRKETMFYGMLLRTSMHPELLLQKDGRRQFLEQIRINNGLTDWEVRSISRGDIPYAFLKLTDRNLYIDTGRDVVENYLDVTFWGNIQKRLQQMSGEDCAFQKEVLRMSLLYCSELRREKNSFQQSGKISFAGTKMEKKRLQEKNIILSAETEKEIETDSLIQKLLRQILKRKIQLEGKSFWLTLKEYNGECIIEPMDMYFYSGISGMAVLFRKCQMEYGGYEEICAQLEQMMFTYTDRLYQGKVRPATNYTGMYCGEGSMVYVWQLLYHMTGDKKYSAYASKHAEVLKDLTEEDVYHDLLYGNAGAVLVLCQQYEDTGDGRYLQYAKKAFLRLDSQKIQTKEGIAWLEEKEGNPICSAAHGNSGILLAYAKMLSLYDAMSESKGDSCKCVSDEQHLPTMSEFRGRIMEIIRYEDKFFDEESGNWADLRSPDALYNTYAWCNGGIGIVWARLKAYEMLPKESYLLQSTRKAKNLLCNMPVKENMCLCHGNVGNYIVLSDVARIWKDSELYRKKAEMKDAMRCRLKEGTQWEGNPLAGIMNGCGGVILTLLEEMWQE